METTSTTAKVDRKLEKNAIPAGIS